MDEPNRTDRPELPRTTEISNQTVSNLGAKLDEFAAQLSEDEQMTLATAFALATRGFLTFPTGVACHRDLRVGVGRSAILVERIAGASRPKLSEALVDAFCPRDSSRFSIEGLEVERSTSGSKSVAAWANPSAAGAKSVAAWADPSLVGSKSVAACANPGYWGARVLPAGWRAPGVTGSKSVAAAACANPALMGAKSVAAACRNPGLVGGKSVAATCRNPGLVGGKSVAAACRMPGAFGGY